MALWGEKVNFINRRRVAVDEGKEMGFCLRGKDLKVRCVCVCVYLTCVHEHAYISTSICMCVHVCAGLCDVPAHVYLCISSHMCVFMCVCVHT